MALRLSVPLTLRVAVCFLPAAALGTVGHEVGHWAAAWALGCEPVLHFASTSFGCDDLSGGRVGLGLVAGPLSSMLTGMVGLWGLRRVVGPGLGLSRIGWSVVALFWSRPAFNAVALHALMLLGWVSPAQVRRTDEARLEAVWGLPSGTLVWGLAALGAACCVWAAWQVPAQERGSWAVGAAVGSLIGFAAWMAVLGPALLP